ncbi:MAG TPA: DUF5689 domain-containing protein [Chitinophagaceae bacterium]|nr:hypothetical protein [Chitinophagaceae bacterium]MCC6635895.1 hypothetical protein [Chitinophagaceae bacterium]HNF29573.1 DUF5689 domain-containing protein [Chitinophagaceae bacterium]HNM33721.1 DUF5689 domain-containing protein [Chitinophagaceae bacterium]HNN30786.1 DUF5689 domain-containing protein [Chitinophagaceae bacterium]
MKNKHFNWLVLFFLTITTITIIAACNKKFDEPDTTFVDPNLPITMTLKELKALLPTTGTVVEITVDKTISGIVVADDKSGNFYKSISIQDATGGVSLRLDGTNLYTSYPVGRRVYINVKGLCVGEYGGMIQLGAVNKATSPISQTPIPQNLFDKYVIKGGFGNVITPKIFSSITDLKTTLQDTVQNTLIQLENFQFSAADTLKTFADPSLASSAVNLNIQNCSGNTITLRTSSYSNFAGIQVPKKKGTITAIYTFFNGTKQLLIRDTSDVQFKDDRCGSSISPTLVYKSIQDVRAMGDGAIMPANTGIRGTIVSNTLNESNGNYRIQDGSGYGLQLRFPSINPNFALNDSVAVDISGLSLSLFNGDLQITNVVNAIKLATGTVVPRNTTVSQINSNINSWSSTVVKLTNVSIAETSSNATGKNYTVTDASGSIVSFVRTTLGVSSLPANATTFIGYVSLYNGTPQITIRNAADVVAGGSGPGGGGSTTGITLGSTSPFTLNFNGIGSGLPTGVSVYTGATTTSFGTAGSFNSALGLWANFSAGFKNFASATGLSATSDQTAQDAASNRALGVRQTSSTGYDPGASFVFLLDNTTGKNNVQLQFLLQSLDNSVGRTVTWTVDYALGDSPASFTAASASGTLTTSNVFSSNTINVNFGNAIDNKSQKVWIRVSALSNSTGSANRPSTAIDDVSISWN